MVAVGNRPGICGRTIHNPMAGGNDGKPRRIIHYSAALHESVTNEFYERMLRQKLKLFEKK